MTKAYLAEATRLYASHVSDYFSGDESKRALPAEYINAVEIECGNRFITQWVARQAGLTILEQYLDKRAA
jgi:hypothetical protein